MISYTTPPSRVPSGWNPPGLLRSDGKRTGWDDLVVPWKSGCPLVWDAIYPRYPCGVLKRPSNNFSRLCGCPSRDSETWEVLPPDTSVLFSGGSHRDLCCGWAWLTVLSKISGISPCQEFGNEKSTNYLLQIISIAVQQGNVMGYVN